MRFSTCTLGVVAVAIASAQTTYIGFNTGSTFTDGTAKKQADFEAEFKGGRSLPGTDGAFTSARLYTMIQGGTTNTPIAAIPAAIDTQTTLLLGLWASAGQADFTNELTALTSAIYQYGTAFTSLIAGISIGSEDLYRNSPTGILANGYNAGAQPTDIVNFIGQVRTAIATTSAAGIAIGHVDTWTAWVNGSNNAVISACDWLGMDAYPYYQTTMANSIEVANSTFFDAYDATLGVAQGKHVWVTETGWPVSGPQENQAVASPQNAELYWQDVACSLLGKINIWWFTLRDAAPAIPSPSFGIIGSDLNSEPLYNLTCSNGNTAFSSAAPSSSSAAVSTASSATAPATSAGPNTESVTVATPHPETSPASVILSQTSAATSTQASGSVAPTSSNTPAPSGGSKSCPADLSGEYQYPHLLVPVNSLSTDTAYGTMYNGAVSPTISSLLNFDLPPSYAGKTCSLVFFFSNQAASESSVFAFNNQGGITFDELASPVSQQTTYNNVPATSAAVGSLASVKPGNSYIVASQACRAGQTLAFEMKSTGGLDLTYFQYSGPSPMGVYITAC